MTPNVFIFPIGVLLALAVLAALAGLIVLFLRKPKAGAIVLGGLAVAAFGTVFFMSMVVDREMATEQRRAEVARAIARAERTTQDRVEPRGPALAPTTPDEAEAPAGFPPSTRTTIVVEPAMWVLVGLAVVVVILLVKKPKVGAVVLGALLLMAGIAYWMKSTPPRPVGVPVTTVAEHVEKAAIHPPEWSPPEGEFEADVYPSARAAAEALAGKVNQAADKVWQGPEPPALITLLVPDRSDVQNDVQEVIRRRWPQARFAQRLAPSASRAASEANELQLRIRITGVDGRDTTLLEPPGGQAVLEAFGPSGSASAGVNFVRKPWADDFSKYVADSPGRTWIVASSPRPCASSSEAQKEAHRQAARQLAPLVRQEMRRLSLRSSLDGGALDDRIEREVRSTSVVQDQFLQRFRRSYGDVWKASLLLDGGPTRITAIAVALQREDTRASAETRVLRSSWLRTGLSMAGLVVLTVLVYLLLNAATKGYYAGRLRAVAAIVALAVVLLLLVLA